MFCVVYVYVSFSLSSARKEPSNTDCRENEQLGVTAGDRRKTLNLQVLLFYLSSDNVYVALVLIASTNSKRESFRY